MPYRIVRPGEFEKTDFAKNYDVVVFPDSSKSILMQGKRRARGEGQYSVSSYPPEYTRGIGKKGLEQLMTFLDSGGIIISWGRSTELSLGTLEIDRGQEGKEEFELPVRDLSKMLKASGLYCSGALVKILLKTDHPITLGMPEESGILYEGGPVFSTAIPDFDMDRRVIGKFPESDILLSGYCESEEKMGNRTALVWLKKGTGQLVLFGFNPVFRAPAQVSFKLLLNSILLPTIPK